ncbi:magnesium chelatase domain-containing protein [Streptomyces sp. NPDC088253]|uniref:magnesium chelatase domain-containing protein n=1 Tax=Streptomyces sp. NPDC088253 TaxID=3365846 RepID=UPI00380B5642
MTTQSEITRAYSAGSTGIVSVEARINPDAACDGFRIAGWHDFDSAPEGRIHEAIRAAGLDFPEGLVAASIGYHRNLSSTLDLATACAVLGAAGQLDAAVLRRTLLIGELRGFDGHVNAVCGAADAAGWVRMDGFRAVVVPAAQLQDVRALGLMANVIGVRSMRETVDYLNSVA